MRLIRTMQRLSAGFMIAAVVAFFPAQIFALPRPGQPAPVFKAITTSGQAVSLESFRGNVLVIDFFATWCQPCRVSIPHLIKLDQKYGKQRLKIIGLSVGEDGERAVRAFAADRHVTYPVAVAEESTVTAFGIHTVPVAFVIDKNGKIAEIYRGFSDEIGQSMEQLSKKLLVEK